MFIYNTNYLNIFKKIKLALIYMGPIISLFLNYHTFFSTLKILVLNIINFLVYNYNEILYYIQIESRSSVIDRNSNFDIIIYRIVSRRDVFYFPCLQHPSTTLTRGGPTGR